MEPVRKVFSFEETKDTVPEGARWLLPSLFLIFSKLHALQVQQLDTNMTVSIEGDVDRAKTNRSSQSITAHGLAAKTVTHSCSGTPMSDRKRQKRGTEERPRNKSTMDVATTVSMNTLPPQASKQYTEYPLRVCADVQALPVWDLPKSVTDSVFPVRLVFEGLPKLNLVLVSCSWTNSEVSDRLRLIADLHDEGDTGEQPYFSGLDMAVLSETGEPFHVETSSLREGRPYRWVQAVGGIPSVNVPQYVLHRQVPRIDSILAKLRQRALNRALFVHYMKFWSNEPNEAIPREIASIKSCSTLLQGLTPVSEIVVKELVNITEEGIAEETGPLPIDIWSSNDKICLCHCWRAKIVREGICEMTVWIYAATTNFIPRFRVRMDLIDKSLCFRHEKVLSEEVMNMRIGEMPEISSSHWSHGNNGFLESLGRFVSREVPARLVSRGFAARHAALAVQLHCLKARINIY
eukprot:GHVL01002277.1.p1 GENE.GHVL01002277.1~~GHVL01002277.1.p1  ORF type:complete len:463 (+),score=77.06 GHVL01002277.1:604-1992(+)